MAQLRYHELAGGDDLGRREHKNTQSGAENPGMEPLIVLRIMRNWPRGKENGGIEGLIGGCLPETPKTIFGTSRLPAGGRSKRAILDRVNSASAIVWTSVGTGHVGEKRIASGLFKENMS